MRFIDYRVRVAIAHQFISFFSEYPVIATTSRKSGERLVKLFVRDSGGSIFFMAPLHFSSDLNVIRNPIHFSRSAVPADLGKIDEIDGVRVKLPHTLPSTTIMRILL